MKTPQELAEQVVEGYRNDELPGALNRMKVAIADALSETREACARICDERSKRHGDACDFALSIEAESCAAAIRAGCQS